MDEVGLEGEVVILGVLSLDVFHYDPLLTLQVEGFEVADVVAPETNADGLNPIPDHDADHGLALAVGCVGGLLFDVFDEANHVHVVAVGLLLHQVVPFIAVQGQLPCQFLIVDLNDLVLLVLQPDLRAVVLEIHHIESSDVVALAFPQVLLVVHGQSARQMHADQLALAISQAQVADTHRPVFSLLSRCLEPGQPALLLILQ